MCKRESMFPVRQENGSLVVAYFTMDKEAFIQRFFSGTREFLERATTARSYRAIVDSLGNRDQIRIVTQPLTSVSLFCRCGRTSVSGYNKAYYGPIQLYTLTP